MSSYTPNKGLFKWNPSTDGNQQFNINKALNENWDKIDAEKIGGRNYVLNTENFVVETTNGGSKSTLFNFSSDLTSEIAVEKLKGKDIVVAYDYEVSDIVTDSSSNNHRYGIELAFHTTNNTNTYIRNWRYLADGNGSGRAVATGTIPANWDGTINQNRLYIQYFGEGSKIKLSKLKIEVGNQATDWTPAPEDKVNVTDLTTKSDKKYATKAINTAGWYRIAQFKNQNAIVKLWNNWNNTSPQEITMIVNSANSIADANIEILSCNNTNCFTKLRLKMIDNVNYLDAYYNVSVNNNVSVEVFSNHNEVGVLEFESDFTEGTTKFEMNLSTYNLNTTTKLMSGETLRVSDLLPSADRTFDGVKALNKNSVFNIDGNQIEQTSGYPTGAYNYGLLLTFPGNEIYGTSQIYIPDQPYNRAGREVYLRNRNSTGWKKLAIVDEVTTGTELMTNEIIDGKRVYRKRIDLGALPNSATKEVSHGLTNFTLAKMPQGFATNNDNTTIAIPFANTTASNSVYIVVNATKIKVVAGSDRSGYSGYVDLYYTKVS